MSTDRQAIVNNYTVQLEKAGSSGEWQNIKIQEVNELVSEMLSDRVVSETRIRCKQYSGELNDINRRLLTLDNFISSDGISDLHIALVSAQIVVDSVKTSLNTIIQNAWGV